MATKIKTKNTWISEKAFKYLEGKKVIPQEPLYATLDRELGLVKGNR